jgi:(2R)-ethylmalonyl-CoA mutase
MDAKVEALKTEARDELNRIQEMGGAIAAVESAYMKEQLVASNSSRLLAIEAGEQSVIGVNKYIETAPSPLTTGEGSIMVAEEGVEAGQIARLQEWRAARDNVAVEAALADLKAAAKDGRNIMEPSIACAKAGVTTGEWGQALRNIFGEYRAPTGVKSDARSNAPELDDVRELVNAVSVKLGRRLKFLVGKPGLDGHSNGAEQIAVRARDSGMDVVYEGIRLTPAEIVDAAINGDVHVLGLSILSGSHVALVTDVMARLKEAGISIPVVVGGIIPPDDAERLKVAGVAAVYTPKDFQITDIMTDVVRLVDPGDKAA